MSYEKTKGVIIKEVNTGEADKIVTVFTRGKGKIHGFAKGARRPKSKLVAGTQLLCYSDIILYRGRDMYSVNSCEVIEPFYEIRNDIFKLTYAAHIVEIVNDVIQENQPASKMLQLFLNTLHVLAKTDKSPELVTRIFEMRTLSILGYAPEVRVCAGCGEGEPQEYYFSFRKCGFICRNCLAQDQYAMRISPGTLRALRYIIYSKPEELFNFQLSPEILGELGRLTSRYLKDRLERSYTKLDFLKTLDANV